MRESVPRSVLAAVGLVAAATLLFEVVLTRIFAVTLWYYFGTLSISLAMLGMAVAAVLCTLFPARLAGENATHSLEVCALAFVLLAPTAILVHLKFPFTEYGAEDPQFFLALGAQIAIIFLVFFAAGMCITIALFRWSFAIDRVYFCDLVGASIGSLIVVPVLYRFSGPAVAFLVAAAAALAGLLFTLSLKRRWITLLFGGLAALAGVLFVVNDTQGFLVIETVKSYHDGGVQETETARVFEKWSPVSRVAVFAPRKASHGELMRVTNDAGAPTALRKFSGDYSKLGWLDKNSIQIGQQVVKGGHALIIGAGGGMDVMASLYYGREKVTAVEINPVIAELVSGDYADYIGGIFKDPRVTLHVQEGRNFAAGSSDKYDLIQITMIDSWGGAAAGAYIFNESSLYTMDAVDDYVSHLAPDGVLSITRYYTWGEGLRLANMFVRHLLDHGVTDPEGRVAVALEKKTEYQRATVLLKNSPFTEPDVARIRQGAIAGGFGVIYAPGLPESDMVPDRGALLYRQVIDPKRYGADRDRVIAEHVRDLSPPTDDRPFFFFTRRLSDVFDEDQEEHPARRMAMPILYGTFVIFGFVGILSIFLPLWLTRRGQISKAPYGMRSLAYFSMLGIGFMLVEISLIQRLTVFLGHPTYSFVVVLTTILFASGVGSYVSGRWNREGGTRKLLQTLIAIVVLIAIYLVVVYDAFIDLMSLGKPMRILLAVVVLLPPGFLMGMCFPMGMQIARRSHEHLVPWGWGVNGAFSVFASIFSLVLSLNFGLKVGLGVGGLCYAIALAIVWSMRDLRRLPAP